MPVYQIKNISEHQKIGVWKITETQEELLRTLILKGFYETDTYQTNNKQYLKQWLVTRLLLNHFFKDVSIIYDDLGKPSLTNGWKISISHSNEFVAITINKNKDCGIDIEKISPKVDRIKHKFLSLTDIQKVITLKELTIYWGAKEALYKYYGKKEVLFIEHLFIENFDKNRSLFIGKIEIPNYKIEIQMCWEKIEDFVLVYTL